MRDGKVVKANRYVFYTPKINRNYGKTISTFINITDPQNNNKVG